MKTDIKKALAFIKKEAIESPKSSRTGRGFIVPPELVDTLKEQIEKNNGSFAIDRIAFNTQFGWKPDSIRNGWLQNHLNKQYPLENDMEWHIGCIQKTELYKLEIREKVIP